MREERGEELRIQVRVAERHPHTQALSRCLHAATPGLGQFRTDALARRRRALSRGRSWARVTPICGTPDLLGEEVNVVKAARKLGWGPR